MVGRGHWGYMGNSPIGMHPASPPHREVHTPEDDELRELVAAVAEDDVEDSVAEERELELPLINTARRETPLDFRQGLC